MFYFTVAITLNTCFVIKACTGWMVELIIFWFGTQVLCYCLLLEDVTWSSILLFPKCSQSPKFNLCLSFLHHKYQAANDGGACLLLLYPLHVLHNKNLAGVFTVMFDSSYLTLRVNKVAIHYWIKCYWLCLLYNRIASQHCVAGLWRCSVLSHHLCL